MSTTYKKFRTANDEPMMVDAAIRDGSGKSIENNYAKQNGNYQTLTAGNADQLNSTVYVVDKVPYLYRTSGGDADIGNREYDKIIGGSLAVNQLVENGDFESDSTWASNSSTRTIANNKCTITPSSAWGGIYQNCRVPVVAGHKYLLSANITKTNAETTIVLQYGENIESAIQTNALTRQFVYRILSATSNTTEQYARVRDRSDTLASFDVENFMVVDLTAMFGSTIADYIYALEQANAGAGVAWFKNYFKEEYYPFNNGTIKNVKLVSHDMVGFNQWDEEWESGSINSSGVPYVLENAIRSKNYCRCLPNTSYYCHFGGSTNLYAVAIYFYDIDKNFISYDWYNAQTFTTPSNARYFKLRTNSEAVPLTTYNYDICINLSWSGWRNGQYEPYKKNSYPLDTTIELRGIPKLDSNNHLYFDGDEYSSDGKVVRKYGVVDLGTLNYTADHSNHRFYTTDLNTIIKPTSSGSAKGNILCSHYETLSVNQILDNGNGIGVSNLGAISITDIGHIDDTAEQFKSAMSGVYLVYELATTTEENAAPFQEPQIVDDFGTEEYVVPTQDGWQVPVGHDTKYPANLRDKLQRLPDMPSVSQNVTETYVVNYNGTTKKCTFVAIDTWLGSNGYVKQEDISSALTPMTTGINILSKKVLKTGNLISISALVRNDTGSSIPADTALIDLEDEYVNASYSIPASVLDMANSVSIDAKFSRAGLRLASALGVNTAITICITYTLW